MRAAVRRQELAERLARERALNAELRANRAALAKQSERLLRLAQELASAKDAEAAGFRDDIKAANDRLCLERESTAKLEARRAARRLRLAVGPPPPPATRREAPKRRGGGCGGGVEFSRVPSWVPSVKQIE